MEDKGNTVVKQGIDMAVPMALYTTAISLMWIYVDKLPALSYLMLAMLLGGPVLLYYLQRRFFKMSNELRHIGLSINNFTGILIQ